MTFGLSENTLRKMEAVFRAYPEVETVLIYGSRAKGNYREGSDIDLALVGPLLTEAIRSRIWLALDDLNTPYLMDILVLDRLEQGPLRDHIQRVGRALYRKGESLHGA